MQGAAHRGGRGNSGDIMDPTWCNGNTLAWNARDVGLGPTLGTVFLIFVTPITLVAISMA